MYDKKDTRRVVVHMPEEVVIDFMLKLSHDTIPMKKFFRIVTEAYVYGDPTIILLVDKAVAETRTKSKTRLLIKEREKTLETERKFGLNEEEIDDMYDIFEDEETDL